jgi:hypothetical protein
MRERKTDPWLFNEHDCVKVANVVMVEDVVEKLGRPDL